MGKRLDIPCGVIAAPIHIQNFPVGYRPFMGYEGANQIVDLVYNSFTLGMEDHLLEFFGGHDTKEVLTKTMSADAAIDATLGWSADGLAELQKIPGFVRGKVKRNTEKFARDQGHKHHTEGQHALQAMLVGHVAKDGVPARAWWCWFANVAC